MRHLALTFALAAAAFGFAGAVSAEPSPPIKVCVTVTPKTWNDAPNAPAAKRPATRKLATEDSGTVDVRPELYLRRLLEYEVTHDEAYDAVAEGCTEHMDVDLYELSGGWTVFARFSRYAREEKVDLVRLDEFTALAQRLARALLYDKPVQATMTRENVLRADSEGARPSIRGKSYGEVGLGTMARVGVLPTAPNTTDPATSQLRLLTPLSFSAGYRGKFGTWGLEAALGLDVGTTERAARRNLGGGHADYSGGGSLGLHFLRYADAPGINSIYYGGGASFELQRFTVIYAASEHAVTSRDDMWTGGLDLDLLLGYEFMRASSVHFYTQLDLRLPTFLMQDENSAGRIRTYLPGAVASIGILFGE